MKYNEVPNQWCFFKVTHKARCLTAKFMPDDFSITERLSPQQGFHLLGRPTIFLLLILYYDKELCQQESIDSNVSSEV